MMDTETEQYRDQMQRHKGEKGQRNCKGKAMCRGSTVDETVKPSTLIRNMGYGMMKDYHS